MPLLVDVVSEAEVEVDEEVDVDEDVDDEAVLVDDTELLLVDGCSQTSSNDAGPC